MPDMHRELATLTEKIDYMSRQLEEVQPLIPALAVTQAQIEGIDMHIRQLATSAESRRKAIHDIDKRVVSLERWSKTAVAVSSIVVTAAFTIGGYTLSFLSTLQNERNDTNQRLGMLELIVNSPNYEKALEPTKKEQEQKE